MRAFGADVRLEGADFVDAKDAARRFAATGAATFVEDGVDPEIAEGAGTIGPELLRRGDAFEAVVVPLGNGALLTGVGRWIKAAAPMTQVIGVVSRGAPAMAESWRAGPGHGIVTTARAETIADGIAVRVPVPEAVADMHGLVDDVLLVGDDDLLTAMRMLYRDEGLIVEAAGAAGLAALLAVPARFAGQRVATILCGGNVDAAQLSALQ
jgi:threonine dehydratase